MYDWVKHTSGLGYNPDKDVFYTVYDRRNFIYEFKLIENEDGSFITEIRDIIEVEGMHDTESVSYDPVNNRLLCTSERFVKFKKSFQPFF